MQIKSCSTEQITNILKTPEDETIENVEKLRKSQLILMSPQRQENKIVKVYEILPEGVEVIDKTETDGFDNTNFIKSKPEMEILILIDETIREIQNTQIEKLTKNKIIDNLSKIKTKLEI